ncbi:MAG: hypothetical protein ABIV50_10560 [Opitutus sp.]
MSLISDALKRAEQQRSHPSLAAPALADTSSWNAEVSVPVASRVESRRSSSPSLFYFNVVALIAVFAFGLYFFRTGPQPIDQGTTQRAGGTSESAATEFTASPAPLAMEPGSESPATPVPTYTAQRSAPDRALVPMTNAATPPTTFDYELGGTSGVGSTTLLSIVRRDDKRSLWVPVGRTVAEVTAVSYDRETDQAVIRVRGNLLTVVTRDAAGNVAPAVKPAE